MADRMLTGDSLGVAIRDAAGLGDDATRLIRSLVGDAFPNGAHAVVAARLNGTDGAFVRVGDDLYFLAGDGPDELDLVRLPPLFGGILSTRYRLTDPDFEEVAKTVTYTHPGGKIVVSEEQWRRAELLLALLSEWATKPAG